MARAIVLLALLAVLVTCQSQNPGCSSIDLISIPLYSTTIYQRNIIEPVLHTANGRVATWYYDSDASAFRFTPWVSSTTQLSYSDYYVGAQLLDAAREYLAANSTADRKIVYIGVGPQNDINDAYGEDFSSVIAAARRLKQSGVEIHVIYDNDYNYQSFWQQVASPNALYIDDCYYCSFNERYHAIQRGLTGMNATGCAILGANPRVSTFDGNDFVFNGLGDYWLVKASQNSVDQSKFGFQIRMSPCDNSDPSSGTCVRAAAFSTQNNYVVVFYIDPATGLLTTTINGALASRDINGFDTNLDDYHFQVQVISVPGTSDVGYSVTVYHSVNAYNRQFGVVLGNKMGVNAWAVLAGSDMGATSGICGTFDGCMSNDYYSADQMYVNPGDSATNVYDYFSDTWRVAYGDSYFGDNDFDQNTWYYANYPQYSKSFTPREDSPAVTTESAEACKFLSDKSKLLYEACTDSVALGVPQYAGVALGFFFTTCQTYCDYPPYYKNIEFSFIDEEECQAYCNELYFDWDFHQVYNDTNFPYYTVNLQNTYAATAQFSLGGTYTLGYASPFCDSEEVNATVTITCDESPVVDAGADRTVSRNLYGWPQIYLIGSASDVNSNLDYSWQVIEAPMARNTTGYDGYMDPHGYNDVSDVGINWYWTPYAILYPNYPGIYVVELAVFDGCSISYDTVTINVTCDNCMPTVTALAETPYFETSNSYSYSTPDLESTVFNYQFYYYSNMESQWALVSTTTGLKMKLLSDAKIYGLYTVYTDSVINSTTVVTNSTSSSTLPSSGVISDNDRLYRYEGAYTQTVQYDYLDVTTTTTVLLDTVDEEVLTCTVSLPNAYSASTAFYLTNNNPTPDFYPAPVCNGDYNFRVDYSDQCFDASEFVTITHKCVQSPIAQLVTCDPNWKFDYNAGPNGQWPSSFVLLDARDSYSPSGAPLTYLYTKLTQPAWDPATPEIYSGTVNQFPFSFPTPLYSQTATYEFQVSVRDDCSFSNSDKATLRLSCDDQTPVIYSSVSTIKSSNGSIGWNTFTLDATASSNPHDSITQYEIDLVSGDPSGLSSGFPVYAPLQPLAVVLPGAYTFVVRTFDGCWWKNSSTVTVTYQCDVTLVPSVTVTPTTGAYDPSVNSWPTFTFNGAGSTINTNRMMYSWEIIDPTGFSSGIVSNTNSYTLDTASYQEAGVYTAIFTMTDGCNTVTKNYTATVTCPAVSAVTIGVAGTTVTNGTNAAQITLYTIPQTTTGTWVIYNSQGTPVGSSSLVANYTWTPTTLETYTAVFVYGDECTTKEANKTVAATCQWNPTFPLTTSTSTWTYNRFPKFTLAPAITGENPELPAYTTLTDYTYRVLSAPVGSIWAPVNTTITYSNITANATNPDNLVGNVWERVSYQTVRTTTVTTTRVVTLNNGNEYAEGCFAADLPGDYTLQLTVYGYCSEPILSTVTVTAKCNAAPVAKTSYTQEVATGYYYFIPYVIDGLSSTDADGDNLTYYWEVVSVPSNSPYMLNDSNTQDALLQNKYIGRTQLTIPYDGVSGTYGLRLTVSDGCSNSTSDLTVVVSCTNNLAIANPQQSHAFDGYTPVSMSQFTFVATDRCDLSQYWDVIAFTPAEKVTPTPPSPPTSGASQVVASLIALLALIALLL